MTSWNKDQFLIANKNFVDPKYVRVEKKIVKDGVSTITLCNLIYESIIYYTSTFFYI